MTAKFFAIGSFLIRSRNLFVAVGDVTEGEVKPGMSVSVSLGNISVSTRVVTVEVIEVEFGRQEYLGLAFAYEDAEDLEFWQSLRISDDTLELSA